MFSEDDLLQISSLQHLTFCERQWSLIHVECDWSENVLTMEGRQLHEYVHEQGETSKAGMRQVRGLRLGSLSYGLYGIADLVEFYRDDSGVSLFGLNGKYVPYPVEYKRGRKRFDRADEIQLCAQAVCLEEMLGAQVPMGAVYYGEPKRRAEVKIGESLRASLAERCSRARELLNGSSVAVPNFGKHCANCSMMEQCAPDVIRVDGSSAYVDSIRRLAARNLK